MYYTFLIHLHIVVQAGERFAAHDAYMLGKAWHFSVVVPIKCSTKKCFYSVTSPRI